MDTLFLITILVLAFSSSSTITRGQIIVQIPPPRPLCASQYALANYACARLPMYQVSPPSPVAPPQPPPTPLSPPPERYRDRDRDHDREHDRDRDRDRDHDHDNHDHNNNDNHNDHNHDHDDHNHDHHDDHSHNGGHHHHHHHHRHRETYAQQECCKWLKQIDNECVCELLVRLPPLLAKPVHNYTVIVDEACVVTYTCGGRLIR